MQFLAFDDRFSVLTKN